MVLAAATQPFCKASLHVDMGRFILILVFQLEQNSCCSGRTCHSCVPAQDAGVPPHHQSHSQPMPHFHAEVALGQASAPIPVSTGARTRGELCCSTARPCNWAWRPG